MPTAPNRWSPLSDPRWLAALAVLALNDHLWKGGGVLPGVLTGKLSDVAGLVVAPVLLVVLLDLRSRKSLLFAHLATGLVFSLLQLSTLAAALSETTLSWAGSRLGLVARLVPDPTDLISLPALVVSWRIAHAPRPLLDDRPRGGVEQLLRPSLASLGILFCAASAYLQAPEDEPHGVATASGAATATASASSSGTADDGADDGADDDGIADDGTSSDTGEPPAPGPECRSNIGTTDLGLLPNQTIDFTIASPSAAYQMAGTGSCGGEGADMVFEWEVPLDNTYRLSLYGDGTAPLALWVVWNMDQSQGTCQEEIGCALGEPGATDYVEIVGHLEQGLHMYIVADLVDPLHEGEVNLLLEIAAGG